MGALATFSTWTDGYPFTQVTSFAEGAEGYPAGTLYFYQSDMDTSMIDISKNANVSFSITEATLEGRCHPSATSLDPESPPCAKATFQGSFVIVPNDTDEYNAAKKVLVQKHPIMATWPESHDWKIWKLKPVRLWVIDIYGGAADVSPEDYYDHA